MRGRQIQQLGVHQAEVVEHHGRARSERQHAREGGECRVVAFRPAVCGAEILPVTGLGRVLQRERVEYANGVIVTPLRLQHHSEHGQAVLVLAVDAERTQAFRLRGRHVVLLQIVPGETRQGVKIGGAHGVQLMRVTLVARRIDGVQST